jgi:hypothetical protein
MKMLFSPSVILEKIQNDFKTVNESFSGFPESGSLWDECIRTVKDATLMNHIIFNNDVMEIPPVRTFLKANRVLDGGFNTYQKKALDAFWGFVFRDIFFYAGQEDNAKVNVMGVRKAARFINPQSEVMVGDLDEASGKIVVPVPRQKLRMNLAEPGKTSVNSRPELHRADDLRTDDQRIDDRRIDDQRIDDRRIDDQRIDDRRVDDRGVVDQRVEDQRVPDQHLENQRIEDQRIEEQRISDQRIENQRDADRMVEEQRLTEQRLAEQRIENQKLAEAGAEEPGVEEKRIEELRIREPRV